MNDLNQIEKIKLKLRLAKSTDSFLEVFGANSHKYEISKPLNIVEVENFENKHNISLPVCYKSFLTEIGNGGIEYPNSVVGNSGAGPDYGIFSLGHPHHFIVDPSLKYLENAPFFNSETTEEKWSNIIDEMNNTISDEDYDKEVAKVYAGILLIGFCGCSGYLGLMLNGQNKGRVIHTYDEIEYCPHFVEQKTFLDWYENWLDRIISGDSIKEMGRTNQSEKECIARFLSDKEPYWKMVRLAWIKNLTSISNKSLKILWEKFKSEKNEKVQIYILNLLTKFDYENAKIELTKLYNNPIEFLRNLHLYAPEKTFEWKDKVHDIKQTNPSNIEIMEYIKHITEKDLNITTANRIGG